jgi:hypothetical protein
MKLSHYILFLAIIMLGACGKPTDQAGNNGNDEEVQADPNQALYDQVMNLHDEAMPKMDDIYKIKSQIQEKIANSPELVKEKKESLERLVLQLDSANSAMMDWMHQFNPLPDSVDQEEARAYLESQMEKIRKVKEEMTSILEKAKDEAAKN